MTIDATSVWDVTGDSVLTSLNDSSGISGLTITNIFGDGTAVYDDASVAFSFSRRAEASPRTRAMNPAQISGRARIDHPK